MTGSIGFIGISTTRAFARCVAWVNFLDGYTRKPTFVFDKAVQLEPSPIMQIVPLALTKPYPFADPFEVFQNYPAPGAFSVLDDLFADLVIYICGKAPFFAGKISKDTRRRFSLFGLQAATLAASTVTHGIDDSPAVDCAIAVGGDVDNTTINTQPLIGVEANRFGQIASLMDVPFAIAQNQVSFTLRILKQVKLFLSSHKGHLQTTVERPDRNNLLVELPSEDTGIVGNGAEREKGPLRFLVHFVSVGNLSNYAHNHLGGKGKLFSDFIIQRMVQIVLPEHLRHPSVLTNVRSRTIGRNYRGLELFGLLFGWLKLDLRYQFHRCIIVHTIKYGKYIHVLYAINVLVLRTSLFTSPRLKPAVSHKEF